MKAISNGAKQTYGTPRWFMKFVHKKFGVPDLDVCAEAETAVAKRFYTVEDDGLSSPWRCRLAWCNPPWEDITPWVEKAKREISMGRTGAVVFLVPMRHETKWFGNALLWAEEIVGIRPRLNYWDTESRKIMNGISHGSCLIVMSRWARLANMRMSASATCVKFSFMDAKRPKGAMR